MKYFISFIAIFFIIFIALIVKGVNNRTERISLCNELDGVMIVTRSNGSYCIDKSVFIDINGGGK